MSIHIGLLVIEGDVVAKLAQKHFITEDEVRGLLQWPARVLAVFDEDEVHGPRWVALAYTDSGAGFFAALDPLPPWEDENADTWRLRTAYWVDG